MDEIRKLISETVKEIMLESTSNYWPGYSDDGTSDWLSDIRDKTSKVQNDELRKAEKEIIKQSKDNNEERKFWSTWMYANMITTSLQDGFYIDIDLIEKALKIYEEDIMSNKNLKKYIEDSKQPKYFPDTIGTIIKELKKGLKGAYNDEYIYAPGFLDRDRNERQYIEHKYSNDDKIPNDLKLNPKMVHKYFVALVDDYKLRKILKDINKNIEGINSMNREELINTIFSLMD